jgi:hypothetical protein
LKPTIREIKGSQKLDGGYPEKIDGGAPTCTPGDNIGW